MSADLQVTCPSRPRTRYRTRTMGGRRRMACFLAGGAALAIAGCGSNANIIIPLTHRQLESNDLVFHADNACMAATSAEDAMEIPGGNWSTVGPKNRAVFGRFESNVAAVVETEIAALRKLPVASFTKKRRAGLKRYLQALSAQRQLLELQVQAAKTGDLSYGTPAPTARHLPASTVRLADQVPADADAAGLGRNCEGNHGVRVYTPHFPTPGPPLRTSTETTTTPIVNTKTGL
jgi:hypothetical protein